MHMFYNYQFVTTYSFYDKSLQLNNPISCRYSEEVEKTNDIPSDDVTPPETYDDNESSCDINEEFTSKYLYDNELLYAFNMVHYDANILSDKIFKMYTYLKSNRENYPDIDRLLQIANEMSMKYIFRSEEFNGFMILFSFDFFHITHLCICDILNENNFGTISKNNMEFLIKNVEL